jgi:hypothetical protein
MSSKIVKKGTKNTIGAMTDQHHAFVNEYVIDYHGRHAAIRAGYSEKTAACMASKLLARDDVAQAVRDRIAQISAKTGISAARVIEEAWGIATADVNELVEFRRGCCRHCYGIDFGHQRTTAEMSRDRAEYETAKRKAIAKDANAAFTYDDFDERGGIGYDARKAPNTECTACWGEGVGQAHFKDTRTLTPAGRALYAGVKQTKDGYQMLLVDKLGAMEKLFKHLGLYKVDNEQKADAFAEFLLAIQNRGSKLPIKAQ